MAPSERLAVTLDVGPAVHQGAGLSRYARRLAYSLHTDQAHRVDLTLFYNAHSGHPVPELLQGIPTCSLTLGQYPWRLGALASHLVRSQAVERRLASGQIYHATEHLLPYLRRPTVLTVHDLIFLHYPQYHTWTNRTFLRLALPLFVRAAHGVIAVSQATRQDLMQRYATPGEKVRVIYEGIDERFSLVGPDERNRVQLAYSPHRPYLLMVGTLEPRKNHLTALQALAWLKTQGYPHQLLIVGAQGWLFEPIQRKVAELGLTDSVHFVGYAPDGDLPALYAGADCVLMPSLFEGFGFPVLEAMACGAPVVCSDVSSLPEVAGEAALLIAPLDHEALAAAVQRVLVKPGLAAHMREQGVEQAANFRWERCAAETADLYWELAERWR